MMHDLSLFGRIALACGLGFVIGWEREVRGHPAGSRTFALVAGGSAAFTAAGMDAFPNDTGRLIQGIITGIGFIGAGVILRNDSGQVHGLTTAAAIWAIAVVGVLSGAARLLLATLVAALFLIVLEQRRIPILRSLDARRYSNRFENDFDDHIGTGPQGQ